MLTPRGFRRKKLDLSARKIGKILQNPFTLKSKSVYRKYKQPYYEPGEFELPFEGKLSKNNRWVIMAKLISWSEFEQEYASLFSEEMGAPAKSFRMALGSLIIKEKLGTSDIETVEQIRENPYLQYFIGLSSYSNEPPFDSSMLSHFRQRIDIDLVNKINESMVKKNKEETLSSPKKKGKKKKFKKETGGN